MKTYHGQKADGDKVVADYIIYKNLQKVADIHGISRERVRQIRNKAGIKNLHIWEKNKYGTRCLECKRLFRYAKFGRNGYCVACYEYLFINKNRKRRAFRGLFYPKNCIECGVRLKDSIKGRCRKCHYKTPQGKEDQRIRTRKWFSTHKEEQNRRSKEYREKHVEILKARARHRYRTDPVFRARGLKYHKEYYKKNRDRLLAYYKQYHLKRKKHA